MKYNIEIDTDTMSADMVLDNINMLQRLIDDLHRIRRQKSGAGDIPEYCKPLLEAIGNADSASQALQKYLKQCGISDWHQLTKSNLYRIKETMLTQVCASSTKTYLARLRAILNRYCEDITIPCRNFSEALRIKAEKPQKAYLNDRDLWEMESVKTNNDSEEYVKRLFLVSCYTGARVSDALRMTRDNIKGNMLTYVSKKTSVEATVPLKPIVAESIAYLDEHRREITISWYNRLLRRLCERAGITETVKVKSAGKDKTGPKYKFISSHKARVSFCTNLADKGASLMEIKQLAGHTNSTMTESYIVERPVQLSGLAMGYFK